MNILTDKGVYEQDELFATLGTSVGKLRFPSHLYADESGNFRHAPEVLIYDTIGFIRDLPPELVDAFSSTLEESLSCDILLHTIDASDSHIQDRIDVTDAILERIGATQPRWYIFNQIDRCDKERRIFLQEKYEHLDPLFVSAKTGEGVDILKERISAHVR